jgi:hypothetical protein
MNKHHAKRQLLAEVKRLILRDRAKTHGDSDLMLAKQAALINALFDTKFTAADVGMLQALLKIVRWNANKNHKDNYADLIGYVTLTYSAYEHSQNKKH